MRRGADLELVERCRPYAELLPGVFFSHVTAARLHGIPLPYGLQQEPVIDLSRDRGLAMPRRKYVAGHRLELDPGELTMVSSLPVTSLPRTLLDLAAQLPTDDLVVMGDWMISEHHRNFGTRRIAQVPLKDLRHYAEAKAGARGVRNLRSAIELMRVGVDSPQETRVRLELHRAGLPEFTPNTLIADAAGNPAVWVDLGCREYRTCIEYDGAHHLDPGQQSRDNGRDARTAELGWRQVKLNSYDMAQGPSWVVGKVRHALVQGGYQP
ncbi:hypothetical protein [Arthrobacter sp. zg-Y1219]|uniref:endonuclease domain-containing protein n=1 Tax=Arthrobacter sp. zg-Y1219 TaxID=3049067 RepID=UPI0024C26B44|nr:hypothetical protein [Arthrobacter sp. zg-Y1219]